MYGFNRMLKFQFYQQETLLAGNRLWTYGSRFKYSTLDLRCFCNNDESVLACHDVTGGLQQ